ncbi:bifunctional type I 3-dehydroquinate dehydratase/shikimate dehydrogenase [Rubinisphaera brasiliensis]|uniref:Dehydroquinase class I n=1 Tax=Rubinisphaera brasiliensis (strain ATCC 49424 / DSM 5305 / JCM 21570 / IAM 15109 / NBRC 103401 / IFAM 1448) TaxID=756272 RepID=F0SR17_RUBBR|nr:type I 3-dehydroquinate dehydratase [Rubinisphaera brasiliensis]ADY61264.1 dehydroquinase class I [Rubinisphaera brasiliensis DSM 5305]
MICISVTPTSRVLAKVDLLNASRHGDIIELCLDHLAKEPDFQDLLEGVSKPVIISCRREQDEGKWTGTEDERLRLIRQAIVAGPDYIELDLDIAGKVPRFGNTQRVISFTRLDRPEYDIDSIFDQAAGHQADVIKFRWPTPSLDDAWPLLAAVSQRRAIPIVGQGLGRPELTFSLLGRKYGSPWIYAALEKGMEAHEGQATVHELEEIYHLPDIDKKTKFIAVAGLGDGETDVVRTLNKGFRAVGVNTRCLPVQIGKLDRLSKMFDILKVPVLIANSQLGPKLLKFAEHVSETDRETGYLDLLLKQADGWHGYNSLYRSATRQLEPALQNAFGEHENLSRRSALVVGTGGASLTAIYALQARKAVIGVTDPNEKKAQHVAESLGIRHVPFQSLYDTHSDIVVLADPAIRKGTGRLQMNPSYFQPHMLVVDLTGQAAEHPLTTEARERGARVLDTNTLWRTHVANQFKSVCGATLPEECFS